MNTMKYKGFEGSACVDVEQGVCHGKILFIDDLVTYESANAGGLKAEFEAAVDDYLETCKELGREPMKPASGNFNVRVPPEMHRSALIRATKEDVSLNSVVVSALGAYLCEEKTLVLQFSPETTVRGSYNSQEFVKQYELH